MERNIGKIDFHELENPYSLNAEEGSKAEVDHEGSESNTIILGKIIDLIHQKQSLLQKIQIAQQKLTIFLSKSPEKDFFDHIKQFEDADENKFFDLLDTMTDRTKELQKISEQSSNEIAILKTEIEVKEKSLAEQQAQFRETVEKTAVNAVHSETGEKFTPEGVKELLEKEDKVLKFLREFQLYSIQKRYRLDLLKKQKSNLSEGPLDFAKYEMMCIEIQNNKEIIHPISEEIKNITKKSSNIINVLSHLEQKLYLAQEEKIKALHKEKLLEKELNQMRDELFAERMKYNKMKHESKELQHKFILLQHPHLIEDYNKVKQENEKAVTELEQLKRMYKNEKIK